MKLTQTIQIEQMKEVLFSLFSQNGFSTQQASTLAQVHTENTLCGVHSHGINRIPAFIKSVKQGLINHQASAKSVQGMGSIERWDGDKGSGVLNAITCTQRAISLAKKNGIGLVALRNTNHWMRAGYYGWMAAEQNCISLLFTNTQANMPPWGGKENKIGNNPLVISIPRACGHVVMDIALSQFSFGKIQEHALADMKLPHQGGWNENYELTDEPAPILKTESGLPIGYWKGSALSMVLDMLATLLSAGQSTFRIGQEAQETNISQVYLCIDTQQFQDQPLQQRLLQEIIDYTRSASLIDENKPICYPGQQALARRKHGLEHGMQVNKTVWQDVLSLLKDS